MSQEKSVLGSCPRCGKDIPDYQLLVEYETGDGNTGIWAECPECEDVVAPQ